MTRYTPTQIAMALEVQGSDTWELACRAVPDTIDSSPLVTYFYMLNKFSNTGVDKTRIYPSDSYTLGRNLNELEQAGLLHFDPVEKTYQIVWGIGPKAKNVALKV